MFRASVFLDIWPVKVEADQIEENVYRAGDKQKLMSDAAQLVEALKHKDGVIAWNNDYQRRRVEAKLTELDDDEANASFSEEEDFLSVRLAESNVAGNVIRMSHKSVPNEEEESSVAEFDENTFKPGHAETTRRRMRDFE